MKKVIKLTGLLILTCSHWLWSVDITFRVNMSLQIQNGNFNPDTEYVDIAGTFNNWGGQINKLEATENNIYVTTITGFSVGQNIEYKFRYNGKWDGREEFPGAGNNRQYTVIEGENIIEVWYNNEQPEGEQPLSVIGFDQQEIYDQSLLLFLNNSLGSFDRSNWTVTGPNGEWQTEEYDASVLFSESGDYVVSLEISNSEGQSSSSTKNIKVLPRQEEISWWNESIFYEIFVRSFQDSDGDGIGDFKGLTNRLDYLNDGNPNTDDDLGITAIWLMPINPSGSYHGYDVIDYRAIHSELGTMDDFKEFLSEAHQRGIKVIIDLVMNHTSTQNNWFVNSSQSIGDYRDWYIWRSIEPNQLGPWGQQVWHRHQSGSYYYGLFWGGMPDLNYSHTAVKEEIFDIAEYWVSELGVDGFRLDAARYLIEDGTILEDTPGTLSLWRDFQSKIKSYHPGSYAIGEVWANASTIVPYIKDQGLDQCFEFSLSGAIIDAAQQGEGNRLIQTVSEIYAAYPHLQWGTFISNHDTNRAIESLSNDPKKLRLAATLQMTLPGTPYIYYGNEIGMKGIKPDENLRRPMQWSTDVHSGFSTRTPWHNLNSNWRTANVEVQQKDENSIINHYKTLIDLRTSQPALLKGNFRPVFQDNDQIISFERSYQDDHLIVIVNTSTTDQSTQLVPSVYHTNFETIGIAGNAANVNAEQGSVTVQNLSPQSVLILKGQISTSVVGTTATDISVYPNPVGSKVFLNSNSYPLQSSEFTIYNQLGQGVLTGSLSENSIDVSHLTAGFYVIRISHPDYGTTSIKVIKKSE